MADHICRYHITGVPEYARGKRFYKKGCDPCEEKLRAGKVSESDPTPDELREKHGPAVIGYGRGVRIRRSKSENVKAAMERARVL